MKSSLVHRKRIRRSPTNARKKALAGERRAEFLASLKTHGVKVPLIGVEDPSGAIVLVDGHCRFELGCEAGIEEFPVCTLDRMPTESELLTVQLVINGTRNDVCAVDLYETYSKLIQINGWTQVELAEKISVSEAKVSSVLSLGKFSPEQRQFIRERDIPPSAVYAVGRMPPERWNAMLEEAAAGKVTRDQLNGHARKRKNGDVIHSKRITFETPNATFSIQGTMAFDLDGAIKGLEQLARDLKKLRSQKLDISTAAKVMQDQTKAAVG